MLLGKLHNSVRLFLAFALLATFAGCTKKVDDKDNSINVVIVANVKGLDPLRANDLYSSMVIAHIFEGLLNYQYLKRPYELQPSLGDGMPTVTDNGLTYTFKIKKGVKFQDDPAFPGGKGRDVTSEDFVYSWKRLADPRNASEGFWVFDGKIKGLNEWANSLKMEKANYDTPVEGLQTPDHNTLVVKLIKPYYQLQYVLAMPFTAVVAKEVVQKYGNEVINHPVGTGPFQLESWVHNSKISLKKNPTFHGETYPTEGEPGDKEKGLLADAGKPLPFADKLVFTELIESQPRWQNFMKGNFEFLEIPKDNFDSAVKDKKIHPDLAAKGMSLDINPNLDVTYVAFNMKDALLGGPKGKELRRAIAYAIDAKTMTERFYNGRAIEAQSPIPPGISSYDPKFINPNQGLDLEKAKAQLVKAGFPEGKGLPALTYETLSDSTARQQAEFLQQNLAAIGVKLSISANSWPQFQEKIKGQKAQIFGIAWGADYPDAQNFYQLFYSKNMSPGPNDSSFSNAAFDKLYEQSLMTPPGPERDQLYTKMRDIVVEEAPWVYNHHRVGYRLVHGWVQNFKYHEVANDMFKYVKVDPKKRAELKVKL